MSSQTSRAKRRREARRGISDGRKWGRLAFELSRLNSGRRRYLEGLKK